MATTQLLGTIQNSGSDPLDGKLVVTLDAPLYLEADTPDALNTRVSKEFTITSGVIDISLEESESAGVTYRFEFFVSDGSGCFNEPAILDFRAIVPNTSIGNGTYQFALLPPTGITTTNLSTSAIVVAKQMLSNPTLATSIADGLNIYRQDAKPSQASAGQIWIRPTTGEMWVYDANSGQWKSPIYQEKIHVRDASSDGLLEIPPFWLSSYTTLELESIYFRGSIAGANDGSNFWRLQPAYFELTNVSATNKGSAIQTNASATSDFGTDSETLTLSKSTLETFAASYTKQGSPGNLNLSVHFNYRFLYP